MSAKDSPTPDAGADLRTRTGAFFDSLEADKKKLSRLKIALNRASQNPQLRAESLSTMAGCLREMAGLGNIAGQLAGEWEAFSSLTFLQLESTLREMCEKRKWRLDGQWPEFIVEYGVTVRINEAEREILIGDGKRVAPADLGESLGRETAELLPKKFSPQAFMAKLAAAYDSISPRGPSQVAILDVYREVLIENQSPRFWRNASSALFTPLSVDQFRARISRMLEAGISAAPDGRELRLFPPLNPRDAVFIFQPSERRFGFVGRIEFGLT